MKCGIPLCSYRVAASLLAGLLCTNLYAAPEAASSAGPSMSVVKYNAGFAQWLSEPRTVELSKDVTFNQDDAYLKTQAAVVQLDDQQHALNARSLGPVHLYNAQDDLSGLHGFIDFTKHLATLTENVVLVVKPGPTEKSAPPGSVRSKFTEPATLACDLMTYDYRHKIGHVPGPLTVTQKDSMLTADSGEYDSNTQTVTLTGHVHGHNGDYIIDSPQAVMNVKEGHESITLPLPSSGVFKVHDDVDSSTGTTPTAASTRTPADSPPTLSPAAPGAPAAGGN